MTQAQPVPPPQDARDSGGWSSLRRSRAGSGRSRAGSRGVTVIGQTSGTLGRRDTAPPQAGDQKKPPNQRQSRGLRLPVVPFSLGIACGFALAGPVPHLLGTSLAGLVQAPKEKLADMVNPFASGQRQVLVLGTDRVADNTDVMFTVQVKNGATHLTQVPRDTFVESERLGVVKANALFAFGGVDAVKEEMGRLLDAPVERYVRINLRAVERLADALGGIEVDVPKRMYYVDNAQGLYIDLYPGPQLLKGETLEGFLRFRHDEMGDLGRMERQKLVLSQVFRKLVSPMMLAELPRLLKIAGEDIQTDLSPIEMGQLLSAMTNTQLSSAQVPGRLFWYNDLSYWMPDSNRHYPATSLETGLDSTAQP
ncbi:LCP family protein [Cyanobium sp. NIES-981]|uniref:LCP family protein n=1 Tax=Cyanobium sp. NIES-981 TaxID=1851505 RepID=UPI0007DDC072|nr:LCP family protein [Cyanobium sp. NIES-981]SBO44128.1 Transcriptional regulator [Cyanobium sp. NIES-981]